MTVQPNPDGPGAGLWRFIDKPGSDRGSLAKFALRNEKLLLICLTQTMARVYGRPEITLK
jgi:hypothetical protein